ncbi:hypothetical protein [Streptomyces sp. NPDC058466]|uniref:hypothetical protein n=1 Tax=Streptomyces sp. NPDC058466 TaxID=3346512 RepID=UPI003652CC6A
MDLHAWITQQVDTVERIARESADRSRTAAILRRCEADRRILARHRRDPDCLAWAACKGCRNDDWGLPNVDNLNDCPELLDLAHAHGITDEILARLDRPQAAEPKPIDTSRYANGGTLTPGTVITTSDVPEALRGPRWKL